ncbi:calnexin homolog [Capsicum annuum]|uniref:calnexin homolog n=1 Tax=Capsicum annuum TaxID=4072 RepID=UPI001FB0A654|nr:calnexin homolog [Capsicum annuum]
MEESKRKIFAQYAVLLLACCFFSQLYASSDLKFYESFDEAFDGKWIVSEKEEYSGEVLPGSMKYFVRFLCFIFCNSGSL